VPAGVRPRAQLLRTRPVDGAISPGATPGLLPFRRRVDTQIKSRGYRIELARRGRAASTAWLAESAVVAIPGDAFRGWTICCATCGAAAEPPPARVRESLSKLVPSTCCRRAGCAADGLPAQRHGKVDRPQLRAAFQTRPAPEPDAVMGAARHERHGGADMTQAVRGEAEVLERLRALFAGQFHAEVADADTDLLASGVLDSLRLVELLPHIEQTFACACRRQHRSRPAHAGADLPR